jgi:hypothetical protein
MSEWLIRELLNHSIDAALVETRQANKALSAMTVKIDATTPAAITPAPHGLVQCT